MPRNGSWIGFKYVYHPNAVVGSGQENQAAGEPMAFYLVRPAPADLSDADLALALPQDVEDDRVQNEANPYHCLDASRALTSLPQFRIHGDNLFKAARAQYQLAVALEGDLATEPRAAMEALPEGERRKRAREADPDGAEEPSVKHRRADPDGLPGPSAPLEARPAHAIPFGYGNPSRGDDSIGPELMRLAETLVASTPALAGIDLIQDFQLQIEHAMDLVDVPLALFFDASVSARAPYTFTRLAASQDNSYTTHELSPSSVLHVFGQLKAGEAPPSYLLSVRAELFDLGAEIAPPAMANLEAAWGLLEQLLAAPDPGQWDTRLT